MAPVKYNGVSVGFVKSMHIDKKNTQFIRLILSIERGTPITQSTVASLLPQGITGMTYLGLKNTKADALPLQILPGEHYPVIKSEPSLFVYFGDALMSATNNLNNISQRFDKLFNDKSITDLKDTFTSIAELSKTLANNKQQIDLSLKSTSRILYNASLVSEQLPVVAEKIQKTLDTVEKMSQHLDVAGSKVNLAMQNVSQQALPVAVRALDHLEQASQNLQKLTSEVQRNPSIIIRGQQAAQGPGE